MAVKLRLTRGGQKRRPFYRIIAANSESRRDGRFLELVGTYNPMTEPATVTIKEDLVKKWISVGAKPTRTVQSLLRKHVPGVVEEKFDAERAKIQEKRKQRKERVAGSEVKAQKKEKRGRKTLQKKKAK